MTDLKLFEQNNLVWIKPVAYLADTYSQVRLLAELPGGKYAFLLPPKYTIGELFDRMILDAAISKYGYRYLENNSKIYDQTQLKDFIEGLNCQREILL